MAARYIGYRLVPDSVASAGTVTIQVPVGLAGRVSVFLDEYSVPHIRSDNEHDLYLAFGYMQGRDRRFQLEMLKLIGYGRLREMIGDAAPDAKLRELDVRSRMLGFYQDAVAIYRAEEPRGRALLEAFAEGINAATEIESVPMEFRVLGYTPERWKPQDTLVILTLYAFNLCKNWEMELARLDLALYQLRTGGTIARALAIYRPWYSFPPFLAAGVLETDVTASSGLAGASLRGLPAVSPELVTYLRDFAVEHPAQEGSLAAWSDFGRKEQRVTERWPEALVRQLVDGDVGSNSWAVDGSWTGTGKAALASDPHMPEMLPPLGYLAHLVLDRSGGREPGGYAVIGGTFAGLPGIVFGTNGSVAWGVTSNWADVTDLYVEKPVPHRDGYYYFRGEELPFTTRSEVFRTRRGDGGFDIETRTVRESIHGVILNDFVERIDSSFPSVALRRNRTFGKPISAELALYRAATVEEGSRAACRLYLFTGHWTLADAAGNVAYAGSVLLPLRTNFLGTFPVPGWAGTYEWNGTVNPRALPGISNPAEGFVATANQQVYPPFAFAFPVDLEGTIPFRYRRIASVLRQGCREETPLEIFSKLQTDGLFVGWRDVRPCLTAALSGLLEDSDPVVRQAAGFLLSWDGQCNGAVSVDAERAPTLFNTLTACLVKMAMEDEVSPASLKFYLSYFNIEPFLYSLLLDADNPAWDDRRTSQQESYAEVLRAGFRKAVHLLREAYGESPDEWKWNRAAPFVLKHPFGETSAIAGFVNRGPIGTSGMTGTVLHNQSERVDVPRFPIRHGPVLRIAVDLGDLSRSFMCLPGGESGRPSSPHYDDMIELYRRGKGVSMEMDFAKILKIARGEMVFRTAGASRDRELQGRPLPK